MSVFLNKSVKLYLKFVYRKLMTDQQNPLLTQQKVFERILANLRNTKYGRSYGLHKIKHYNDFRAALPIVDYDTVKPFIQRMMLGEPDVLVGGKVKHFSKSSGTTAEVSKFIPVPAQNLSYNHIKGAWDSLALFYHKQPDAQLFNRKSLLIAGSVYKYPDNPKALIGDISALMATLMPAIGRPFFAPDIITATLPDWNEKIEKITRAVAYEDIAMVGGVPTWLIVLFREILAYTGKSNMLEVWPHMQGYFHGGVGFGPYRYQFESFFPSEQLIYHEIYNSSEGFFAVQDRASEGGMMLLINNGILFEFIPLEEFDKAQPRTVTIDQVQKGEKYAMIISSNAGIMRYKVGDVVEFESTKPLRIRITGRTGHFINVFGEEVMVHNTDKAISEACLHLKASIIEYTVAPVYMSGGKKGGHEWLIEFENPPADMKVFAELLDKRLRAANSDYDAKRTSDIALSPLQLRVAPKGTFHKWLAKKNKLGAQHKVPRLSNERKVFEEIFAIGFPSLVSSKH